MDRTIDIHSCHKDDLWEMMWSPYDAETYRFVLDQIKPDDVVFEIGAGDLRLSRMISQICRHIYAVEIHHSVLENSGIYIPGNLTVLNSDASVIPFPKGISVGVLLMRHCTHFDLYAKKLKTAGCERLITNARWRLAVEVIHLKAQKLFYHEGLTGWYACMCGAVGFNPAPPEDYTIEQDAIIHEVVACPQCTEQLQVHP